MFHNVNGATQARRTDWVRISLIVAIAAALIALLLVLMSVLNAHTSEIAMRATGVIWMV